MAKIILDFGSGNTCLNDWPYAKRMIDELKAVDTGKHEVIIKWQLFKEAGKNIPLSRDIFYLAYNYAQELGYQTTSSVFDKDSLDYLLKFDIPFVKIANRRDLDYLIGLIPRQIPVYVSKGNAEDISIHNGIEMICVSKYPALLKDYEPILDFCKSVWRCGYLKRNDEGMWKINLAVSDHTIDFDLWHKYQPQIIEWHYKLEDSTGLDAGPFARTPEQLKEVL